MSASHEKSHLGSRISAHEKRSFRTSLQVIVYKTIINAKKHKAFVSKYKALILKYKAHILKYMPYVFFHILYVFAVTAEIRNFATI
ncbi:MAG: hypothetical protein DBY24_07810 [Prevotellaceae bacterium]|nr:MAG: hypothetical protein DBY24_07810 [Prevotellaceae bacterium]